MKMKKTMKLTASALIASSCLAGCSFQPSDNEPEDIYGPPVMEDEPLENETPEPEYDPAQNEPVDIYGPPQIDDEEAVDDGFDPGDNVAEPLYGPPAGDVRK